MEAPGRVVDGIDSSPAALVPFTHCDDRTAMARYLRSRWFRALGTTAGAPVSGAIDPAIPDARGRDHRARCSDLVPGDRLGDRRRELAALIWRPMDVRTIAVVSALVLIAGCDSSSGGHAASSETRAPARGSPSSASAAGVAPSIVTTTAARRTLPSVWAPPPIPEDAPPATGLGALVRGVLRYDQVNDCFLLVDPDTSTTYPVVWPAGTTADPSGNGVRLADGRTIAVGEFVSGGGGYLDVAANWDVPEACSRLSSGEIAVFNPAFPLNF